MKQKIEIDDIIANKNLKIWCRFNKKRYTVMTYCNAGSLATGGFGTAVGVIKRHIDRAKHKSNYL